MKGTCPWCGLAGHNYVGPPCPGPPGGWPRTEVPRPDVFDAAAIERAVHVARHDPEPYAALGHFIAAAMLEQSDVQEATGAMWTALGSWHGLQRPAAQAEGCTPTSDWGCEARRKLGIARGDLDTIANECEDLEAARGVARSSLHVTAMPNPCRDSTTPQVSQEPALDHATIECLARDMRCPDCGKMMTNHVVVTRHEEGPCDESFTGPPLRSYLGDDET